MIPQYSAVYYLNHTWDRNAYFKEIKSTKYLKDNIPLDVTRILKKIENKIQIINDRLL